MRRWLGVAALALLSAGCPGRTLVEDMPTTAASPEPIPTPTPTPAPTPAAPSPSAPEATPPPPCDPPQVSIARPSEGQTLTSSPQTINTNVSHSVTRVEFYYHIDRRSIAANAAADPPVQIGSRNEPPFRIDWRLPRECTASASLLAIAYNACGSAQDSDFVRVFICY